MTLDVLDNDDIRGGFGEDVPVTVELVTQPAHGTATVNSAGQVTYTPNGKYIGTDVFDYVLFVSPVSL